MAKINVIANSRSSIFTSWCLKPVLEPWFRLISNEDLHTGKYSAKDTVVVASNWVWGDVEQHFQDQGYSIIIDNLWEPHQTWRREYPVSFNAESVTTLESDRFFWCHEYYLQQYHYQNNKIQPYVPQRDNKYIALMQMRQAKKHRTRLWDALHTRRNSMLCSYLALGYHNLPGDEMSADNYQTNYDAQRYSNPNWYNSTGFSLAVETHDDSVDSMEFGTNKISYAGPWPFITEKTLKPIQYQHPFMVWGMSNTLGTLKQWGFTTYDNLFDESYDSIKGGIYAPSHAEKIKIILDNFDNFVMGDYDTETLNRIAHNYARFNDATAVEKLFFQDVVEPIIRAIEHG